MEEMRLFEVGFKESRHKSGYYEKFHVVAISGGEEAIEKARDWLEQEYIRWWEDEGRAIAKWDLAMPGMEKDGLEFETDEEVEVWCENNNLSYDEELLEEYDNGLKLIASLQLAKLYDVGNAIV